jgi:GT2 family glycosyltransferase
VTLRPDLSVIVPTRNRARSLKRTIEAFARQSNGAGRFEVIVVANASLDETSVLVPGLGVPFELRLSEIPLPGMSRARNTGAAQAHGRILVFLDDDIEVQPDFVEAHRHVHQLAHNFVAVGNLLAPPLMRPPDLFVERLRRLDKAFAALLAEASTRLNAFCMIGGNMSLSRELFERVGGFDQSLVAYGGEDYEFGLRAQKLGARFVFVPKAAGFHYSHENTSLQSYLSNARSVGRNDTVIVQKHPEALDHLTLGRSGHSRTALGRVARILAFDYAQIGDALAGGLLFASTCLAGLRWGRSWNRLVDGLRDYWYFRGVGDQVGNSTALARYLEGLRPPRP